MTLALRISRSYWVVNFGLLFTFMGMFIYQWKDIFWNVLGVWECIRKVKFGKKWKSETSFPEKFHTYPITILQSEITKPVQNREIRAYLIFHVSTFASLDTN